MLNDWLWMNDWKAKNSELCQRCWCLRIIILCLRACGACSDRFSMQYSRLLSTQGTTAVQTFFRKTLTSIQLHWRFYKTKWTVHIQKNAHTGFRLLEHYLEERNTHVHLLALRKVWDIFYKTMFGLRRSCRRRIRDTGLEEPYRSCTDTLRSLE